MSRIARAVAFVCALVFVCPSLAATPFVLFESGQVRPLALSPDGARLFAVNTPDNRLEIFDVGVGTLTHVASVPVGLEPVAVAARTNGEVWVVNHLSDSVSVVDVTSAANARVVRTLLVGDEPRDVVFAGPSGNRAFITTAHRGQNTPLHATIETVLTTEGIGRADVWVFDATALGTTLGGTPLTIVTLFGDTPRALTVSPDGSTVYAAVFQSGNRTTTVGEGLVPKEREPLKDWRDRLDYYAKRIEQFHRREFDGAAFLGMTHRTVGIIASWLFGDCAAIPLGFNDGVGKYRPRGGRTGP